MHDYLGKKKYINCGSKYDNLDVGTYILTDDPKNFMHNFYIFFIQKIKL
jgi:hypothetical protein